GPLARLPSGYLLLGLRTGIPEPHHQLAMAVGRCGIRAGFIAPLEGGAADTVWARGGRQGALGLIRRGQTRGQSDREQTQVEIFHRAPSDCIPRICIATLCLPPDGEVGSFARLSFSFMEDSLPFRKRRLRPNEYRN